MPSFFINCYIHMYVCVCVYIYIPKYNLLRLNIYMYALGITTCHWMSSQCVLSWGRLFLLFQAFLKFCRFLCMAEASWSLPSLWHVYCCVLVQFTFGEPCWGDCLVQPLALLGDNVSHQNLILWLTTPYDQIEPFSSSWEHLHLCAHTHTQTHNIHMIEIT